MRVLPVEGVVESGSKWDAEVYERLYAGQAMIYGIIITIFISRGG